MRRAIQVVLLTLALAASASADESVTEANWDLASHWDPMSIIELRDSASVLPMWLDDGARFWYSYRTSDGWQWWLVDGRSGEKRELFDRHRLAVLLTAASGEEHDPRSLSLSRIEPADDGTVVFDTGGARFRYDPVADRLDSLAVDQVEPAPDFPDHWTVSPDGARAVYGRGNDLVMCATDDPETEHLLTDDGHADYSIGEPGEVVPDDGQVRSVDVLWSPDSRHVAFLRTDNTAVAKTWVVDHLAVPRPELHTYHYPMPCEDVARQELWLADVTDQSIRRLAMERWPDQLLPSLFHPGLHWSPDGATLFAQRQSRDYLQVDLCAIEVASGEVRVAVEERQDDQVYTLPPVLLDDAGDRLLWCSRHSGWARWYLVDTNTGDSTALTSGDWNAIDMVEVDTEAGVLFFLGIGREEGRNPYHRHLYRVGLDGTELTLLTPEDGEHSVSFAPDLATFVDTWSTTDKVPVSVLRDRDGNLLSEFQQADISRLTEAGWRSPEPFTALSADGETVQWGVMYKPFDFDPDKRYPVVTRAYPGRQGEFVPRGFHTVDTETYLAQLGCIVLRFGNRGGTWERSWEYRTHGKDDFRAFGLADKRAVIEELGGRHAWIDTSRVGIFGSSSGGQMTVAAMLEHPDFFKVGVAMTAPNDPSIYFNMWAERYAGIVRTEEGTWECAPAADNLEVADRLAGRLLMIYGAADDNVLPAHAMRQAQAFMEAGKIFDLAFIPGADHGLGDWRYLYGLIWDYFAEHLIGGRRESVDALLAPR
ncbi:MAG: prolyl oligopeptidase family serine peptidase [bacterium]|nr:prolyl oligopeptidase family serine peptidase [bacterium]